MRRWMVTGAMLLAVPLWAPPGLAEPSCTAGVAAFCAEATSIVDVDCILTETNLTTDFACAIVTRYSAAGTSDLPGPGQLLTPSSLEIGLCNGLGPCEQTLYAIGTPCSWNIGEGGCETGGEFMTELDGIVEECLYVWVAQDVDARVRVPGVSFDLARDVERAFADFSSC